MMNLATRQDNIPEIKSLNDFDVLPMIVDQTSTVARPTGSLEAAARSCICHRDEPGVFDRDVLGDEEPLNL